MNTPRAHIVLFVFNRPWHTEQCLESLSKCEGAAESELFVFSDGPKRSEDKEAVEKVRELVKSRNWCKEVHITEREENTGLANSIISGVTEIANRYGRVIVLEDDLVLSPQFLNYINDALETYKDEERVMHISGFMFPVKAELPETFFFRGTSCWGWGTWKRAWDRFEPDTNKLLAEFDKNRVKRRRFDIEGSIDYYTMLRAQARGTIDSWAIRWYASVFLNDGLCLHPGRSLVNNMGHDSMGVHCEETDVFDVKLGNKRVTGFTQDIRESEEAVSAIVNFYRAMKRPLPVRLLGKLRQVLKGI